MKPLLFSLVLLLTTICNAQVLFSKISLEEINSSFHYTDLNTTNNIRHEVENFKDYNLGIVSPENETSDEKSRKNIIGFNIWPLDYSGLNIFYERLFFNNKLGFRNQFFYNNDEYKSDERTGRLNTEADFYYGVGLNYYFLRKHKFYLGAGSSFVLGKFTYSYLSVGQWHERSMSKKFILANISVNFIIKQRIPVSLVIQVPLKENYETFFETNISFNF